MALNSKDRMRLALNMDQAHLINRTALAVARAEPRNVVFDRQKCATKGESSVSFPTISILGGNIAQSALLVLSARTLSSHPVVGYGLVSPKDILVLYFRTDFGATSASSCNTFRPGSGRSLASFD